MQYLVRLTPHLPDSLSPAERETLFAAERERSFALQAEGTVARMWRGLGTRTGISLWDVTSPEELHASLSSLPAWPYCDVDIQPVIQHPMEAEFQQQKGARA